MDDITLEEYTSTKKADMKFQHLSGEVMERRITMEQLQDDGVLRRGPEETNFFTKKHRERQINGIRQGLDAMEECARRIDHVAIWKDETFRVGVGMEALSPLNALSAEKRAELISTLRQACDDGTIGRHKNVEQLMKAIVENNSKHAKSDAEAWAVETIYGDRTTHIRELYHDESITSEKMDSMDTEQLFNAMVQQEKSKTA